MRFWSFFFFVNFYIHFPGFLQFCCPETSLLWSLTSKTSWIKSKTRWPPSLRPHKMEGWRSDLALIFMSRLVGDSFRFVFKQKQTLKLFWILFSVRPFVCCDLWSPWQPNVQDQAFTFYLLWVFFGFFYCFTWTFQSRDKKKHTHKSWVWAKSSRTNSGLATGNSSWCSISFTHFLHANINMNQHFSDVNASLKHC